MGPLPPSLQVDSIPRSTNSAICALATKPASDRCHAHGVPGAHIDSLLSDAPAVEAAAPAARVPLANAANGIAKPKHRAKGRGSVQRHRDKKRLQFERREQQQQQQQQQQQLGARSRPPLPPAQPHQPLQYGMQPPPRPPPGPPPSRPPPSRPPCPLTAPRSLQWVRADYQPPAQRLLAQALATSDATRQAAAAVAALAARAPTDVLGRSVAGR